MTQIHCCYWTLLGAQRFPVMTAPVEGHSRNLRNLCNLRIFNSVFGLKHSMLDPAKKLVDLLYPRSRI